MTRMERNRERTRAEILAAVGRLLAREGFADIGVNAVAREAGVDKVLIYRYFGGMEDLLRAYAAEGDFWPSADALLRAVEARKVTGQADLVAGLLIEFGRALRQRPITQEILRWELLERNALTDGLARYREEEAMKLIARVSPPPGIDVPALASLLAAGQTYLMLRAKTADAYNGLRLDSDEDWRRIDACIRAVLGLAFDGAMPARRQPEARSRRADRAPRVPRSRKGL